METELICDEKLIGSNSFIYVDTVFIGTKFEKQPPHFSGCANFMLI